MMRNTLGAIGLVAFGAALLLGSNAAAIAPDKDRVIRFWTPDRIADATPRDLVIDHRGYGYLKGKDGKLTPYGHSIAPMASKGKPGGGTTTTGVVTDSNWPYGGIVQTAAGRILFMMDGGYYVCSGTVITDAATDRSIIITAGHCVYDDVAKAFATNVLFIPNQVGMGRDGTDLNCLNDPLGCWAPSFGVVDKGWTLGTFPANKEWDYAYYVVDVAGAHSGTVTFSDSLEVVAGSLPVSFETPIADAADASDFTYALGYSYKWDPKFRYSAEDMTTNGAVNWWLPSSRLSGGSSGGPWIQPMVTATGSGPIISVNSWGYTVGAGMAGPQLDRTNAACVLAAATDADFATAGTGVVVDPVTCP